jgi:2-polyprenyl-3-methyl-5-hydroxy-6-metoxy-1,4-benzoquinol methylase
VAISGYPGFHICARPDDAMDVLARLISSEDVGDAAYFHGQRARYLRTISRIVELFPTGTSVLDVGSHYLHQACLLSLLGYEVTGIDIPTFVDAAFVSRRAKYFNVVNHSVSDLALGNFLNNQRSKFHIVLFTEVIEHITFNPINFWGRIYELLLEDGAIYLTTPNSMRPGMCLRSVGRIVTLKGAGLPVEDILANVTYGHHWKEYSPSEIRRYFYLLSPDFHVTINLQSTFTVRTWRDFAAKVLGVLPIFRDHIEAIVRLKKKTSFSAIAPKLPIG